MAEIEESFYVVVLMQDIEYYARLIAGITSDFSRNSARIQVLFQRFENTLKALTWLEKRKAEVELSESIAPTVLIIIDPVKDVLSAVSTVSKGRGGHGQHIGIIHKMFSAYSQVAYFNGGEERYSKRLKAHLIPKSNAVLATEAVCKILSDHLAERSHGGFEGKEIYKLLMNRGIPLPPHLQSQVPQPQFSSSGFGDGPGPSVELYEMKSQLLLIQERGKNAINDLEELAETFKEDKEEIEDELKKLRQGLVSLKGQIFGGDLDTNDRSLAGQLFFIQQRLTHIQSEFKGYAKRIATAEEGYRKLKASLEEIGGRDDKGLATQVLAGLFSLAKQKEYAIALIVLALVLFFSLGFGVSIAEMAEYLLKLRGGE